MTDRLTKSDWLEQGLRTLAQEGANALKVGPMAARLEVSRGSFYWHFRDMADFRSQLLRTWLDQATEQVIRRLEAEQGEPDRLKPLLRGAFVLKPGLDQAQSPWAAEDAIRRWAAEDPEVAAMVASVDARRVAYIAKLIGAAGVESGKALSRAAFLYWAYLGQTVVVDRRHALITEAALEDIIALFET